MNHPLSTRLQTTERAERVEAIRRLLVTPLIDKRDAPAVFTAIVRNQRWLARWFSDYPGWQLLVDPAAGLARLFKIPARPDGQRACHGPGRAPFDRRRYVLLCLTLAALEGCQGQTTLARLVELLEGETSEAPSISPFDSERLVERRALVEVLRLLLALRVITLRDGDADRFTHDRSADALYDVDDRVLALLIASPIPPSLARSKAALLAPKGDVETDDARRRRAGEEVLRALLDDPVLYYEDLSGVEREWLESSWGPVKALLLKQVGLGLERRKEGAAAIDPAGEVTDELFPHGGSTVKHGALLLSELLTERARPEPAHLFTIDEVVELTKALVEDYGERCSWRREYRDPSSGPARLGRDALELLERFSLVERAEGGFLARPSIARFAPAAPGARSTQTGGRTSP